MTDGILTGVLSRPHEEVGEVKSGVETDGEGQRAGAAQREAHEEAEQPGGGEVFPALVRLEKIVQSAEANGEQNGRCPEANTIGGRREEIGAELELLRKPDEQVSNDPDAS